VFLRRDRGRADTWGLIAIGVVLCVVSVLGLTGAFGEISSVGRFETIVLFGVPLGILAIVGGIVNIFRQAARSRDDTHDDGSVSDRPGRDRPAPDGMIDR
jgi:hypothetical protein